MAEELREGDHGFMSNLTNTVAKLVEDVGAAKARCVGGDLPPDENLIEHPPLCLVTIALAAYCLRRAEAGGESRFDYEKAADTLEKAACEIEV